MNKLSFATMMLLGSVALPEQVQAITEDKED